LSAIHTPSRSESPDHSRHPSNPSTVDSHNPHLNAPTRAGYLNQVACPLNFLSLETSNGRTRKSKSRKACQHSWHRMTSSAPKRVESSASTRKERRLGKVRSRVLGPRHSKSWMSVIDTDRLGSLMECMCPPKLLDLQAFTLVLHL
jgi:hypothetical protein